MSKYIATMSRYITASSLYISANYMYILVKYMYIVVKYMYIIVKSRYNVVTYLHLTTISRNIAALFRYKTIKSCAGINMYKYIAPMILEKITYIYHITLHEPKFSTHKQEL